MHTICFILNNKIVNFKYYATQSKKIKTAIIFYIPYIQSILLTPQLI